MAELRAWLVRATATRARDEIRWSLGVGSIAIAAIVVAVSVISAMVAAAAAAVVFAEKLVEETHHLLLRML